MSLSAPRHSIHRSEFDEVADQETRLAECQEADNRRQVLDESLSVLSDRERRIFEARWLADNPVPLDELAAEYNVSRERVRQLEVRAFDKVQKLVKTHLSRSARQEHVARFDWAVESQDVKAFASGESVCSHPSWELLPH